MNEKQVAADTSDKKSDSGSGTKNLSKRRPHQQLQEQMLNDIDPPPLYYVTTALCVFMVIWILIFPSSTFQEHSIWRRQLFAIVVQDDSSTPPELIHKYAGHYLVQATHILPGAVWATIIPFQLHPMYRVKYKRLHRWAGYVFIVTALVMAYGTWLILHRRLGFEHFFEHFFEHNDSDEKSPRTTWRPHSVEPGLLILTVYFVATVSGAVYTARQGRFVDHQRYMIRHIASGIWIAVQRVILTTILPVMKLGKPFTRQEQRTSFAGSALIAMGITILAGEYVIYTLRQQQRKRRVD